MNTRLSAVLAVAVAGMLAGCGADEPKDATADMDKARQHVDKTLKDGSENIETAMNEMRDAVDEVFNKDVQMSDQKALKELLPEKVGDLERVGVTAEKRGAVGLTVSMANGDYETGDGTARMAISLTDIGRMGSFASLGLSMADVQIDREDRNGFERTTEYKGYRSVQKMARFGDSSLAEMTVFVEDRVVLQIDAENVEWDVVEKAADTIDLAALARML